MAVNPFALVSILYDDDGIYTERTNNEHHYRKGKRELWNGYIC